MSNLPQMPYSNHERACPCCGYNTLTERGSEEICLVCWWQDDGADTEIANEVVEGSPNEEVSLAEARRNFLEHGTAFPDRPELGPQDPTPYRSIRQFKLQDDGTVEETTAPASHRN